MKQAPEPTTPFSDSTHAPRPQPLAWPRRRFVGGAGRRSRRPATAQFRVEITGVGATQLPVAIATFRDEDKAPRAGRGHRARRPAAQRPVPPASTRRPPGRAQPHRRRRVARPRRRRAGGRFGLAAGRRPLRRALQALGRWSRAKSWSARARPCCRPTCAWPRTASPTRSIRTLTGERGVFATRIAYVTKAGNRYHAARHRRRRRRRTGGAGQPRADHLAGLVARRHATWPTSPSKARRPWSGCRTWPPASAACWPTSAARTARRPGRPTAASWR